MTTIWEYTAGVGQKHTDFSFFFLMSELNFAPFRIIDILNLVHNVIIPDLLALFFPLRIDRSE